MNKIIKCINIKNLAKILVIALLISTCSVVVPVSVSAEDMGTQVDTDVSTSLVSGKSGILMEPSSGTVLYEFNPG